MRLIRQLFGGREHVYAVQPARSFLRASRSSPTRLHELRHGGRYHLREAQISEEPFGVALVERSYRGVGRGEAHRRRAVGFRVEVLLKAVSDDVQLTTALVHDHGPRPSLTARQKPT